MAELKTAVITGASRGIGRAISVELAQLRYKLVLNYLNSEPTPINFPEITTEFITVPADISTKQGRDTLVQATIAKYGKIDLIVNNAGVYFRSNFPELTEESYDQTLNVNLKAGIFLTQSFLPHLNDSSSVIFISSINAFSGAAGGIDYVASKAALVGITHSLANELAPKIRVNAIAPGSINTKMIANDSQEKRQQRIAETPLNRIGQPNDIAHAVAFLASPQASFITGQVLHVNGGKFLA